MLRPHKSYEPELPFYFVFFKRYNSVWSKRGVTQELVSIGRRAQFPYRAMQPASWGKSICIDVYMDQLRYL